MKARKQKPDLISKTIQLSVFKEKKYPTDSWKRVMNASKQKNTKTVETISTFEFQRKS